MGYLIGLLARAGVPRGAQRVAAVLAMLILAGLVAWLALALFRGWIGGREDAAVARNRDAASIETLNAQVAAERTAGAAQDARDRTFANDQDQAREAIRNATHDPAGDVSPLDALHDELRRQDAAAHPGRRP